MLIFDCGLWLIVAQGLLILGEFGSLSLAAFLEYLFTQLRYRSQLRSPTILYSDLKITDLINSISLHDHIVSDPPPDLPQLQ